MIVIDNFIKDLDFLKRIEESEDFWKEGYKWYDGWWEKETSNLREELIERVWGDQSPHPAINTSGFEHWVGDYDNTSTKTVLNREWALKLHFDKDEELWVNEKRFVTPLIGTIFYPCREIDEMEGGMLYHWEKFPPQRANADTTIFWPEEEPEIIKPKFNRLIIFDAGCLHGVSKIVSGRRRAVAINLWDKKPTEFAKNNY